VISIALFMETRDAYDKKSLIVVNSKIRFGFDRIDSSADWTASAANCGKVRLETLAIRIGQAAR
jgi:hypothetical protein